MQGEDDRLKLPYVYKSGELSADRALYDKKGIRERSLSIKEVVKILCFVHPVRERRGTSARFHHSLTVRGTGCDWVVKSGVGRAAEPLLLFPPRPEVAIRAN